jgi:hypothetical protein
MQVPSASDLSKGIPRQDSLLTTQLQFPPARPRLIHLTGSSPECDVGQDIGSDRSRWRGHDRHGVLL